jgi:hypothetical protein
MVFIIVAVLAFTGIAVYASVADANLVSTPIPPGSARKVTRHSGTQLSQVPCDNVAATAPFHTVAFTKTTTASRLRIGYSDVAFVRTGLGENDKFPWVEVKIDGASITPTPIRMQFVFQDAYSGTFEYSRQFTVFGYAEGITAGSHSLTVRYHFESSSHSSRRCYRGNPFFAPRVDPFHIEIEEIP